MRRDKLFELLSAARVNPVARSRIFRAYINLEAPNIFRVAAGLSPTRRGMTMPGTRRSSTIWRLSSKRLT